MIPGCRRSARVVRSTEYRRLLGELPGYETARTGELRRIEIARNSRNQLLPLRRIPLDLPIRRSHDVFLVFSSARNGSNEDLE